MNEFKCVQRVFPIEAERLEKAIKDYPNAFSGGLAVVTYNNVIIDDKDITDFNVYKTFFNHFKNLGIDMQVNLSATFGHGDDSQKIADYRKMVGHLGEKAKSVACPRDKAFKEYLQETIVRYAELKPSVFWIDDDFRISFHAPIKYACFCDDCLKEFAKITGKYFSREELVSLIVQDGEYNGQKIRKLWQDFNRKAIIDLAKIISDAVHKVDDKIIIGYMQVNPQITICEGLKYEDLIEVSKNVDGEVYFRMGSGFYSDIEPYDIVHKNLAMARLAELSKSKKYKVTNYSEEVTLPYGRRGKSMKMTFLESVMNIGVAGLNGVMDEGIKPNLVEQVKPNNILNEMHNRGEYLSYLKKLITGKKQLGVYPYFSTDLWQFADKTDSIAKMNEIYVSEWERLFEIGIPLTFDEESASVMLFAGKSVRAIDKALLDKWLKKGIFADGQASLELNDITKENVTGVKAFTEERVYPYMEMGELFLDHPLNGNSTGYKRYNIWHANKKGYARLNANGAEILTRALSEEERADGLIGTAVYQNSYGGKVATFSRGAWDNDIVCENKANQIKNVFDYLSNGMPVRVESPLRVGVSAWEDEKERIIFIYNVDFDDADEVLLNVDLLGEAEILNEDLSWEKVGKGKNVIIKNIPSFTAKIIRIIK